MNYYISCLVLFVMLLAAPAFAQPKCDNSTDDTAALQAEFNAAAANCGHSGYDGNVAYGSIVNLPITQGGVCKTTGTITWDASCVQFNGNGTYIWNSNASSPAIEIYTSQNSYSSKPVRDLRLEGLGAVGVHLDGNNIEFDSPYISNFSTDFQVGSYSYVIHLVNAHLFDANIDFSCPPGASANDTGEQITFDGGSLFNSTNAISNYGCHIGMSHASIDAITNLPVDNEGGQFIANDVHFEMQGTIPGAFIKNNGCNSYSHVDVGGASEFYSDNSTGGAVIENDSSNPTCGGSGPYSKIHDDFFSGFKPNPTITGSSPGQVALCANTSGSGGGTMNNIPNQGNCSTE